MPPLRAKESEDDPAEDHPDERCDGDHAEHVDPGADVVRLPVREHLLQRKSPSHAASDGRRPASRRDLVVHRGDRPRRLPGKGANNAITKSTIMTPIRSRLGTEMTMNPRCR